MLEQMNIEMGDPIILAKANEMSKYMLFDGCKGIANSVTVVEDKTYILFHPTGMNKFFWMCGERFILDVEKMKEMNNEQ